MSKVPKKTDESTFEKIIGYRFRDRSLFELALTHRSFIHESGGSRNAPDNDRLEFLGDSVLGLIIAELSYKHWPKHTEGQLTEAKSDMVSRKALARKASRIKLASYMRLGKGQIKTGKPPETILSCGIEALIGAIYLDGGLKAALPFIEKHIWSRRPYRARSSSASSNYKEKLQKLFLEKYQELPVYEVLKQTGPAHRKQFTLAVQRKGKMLGKGEGMNKKEASQQAARQALQKLRSNL